MGNCFVFTIANPSECSSWVQAWGSIIAILGSAWGVHWAHRLEVKKQRREEFRKQTQDLEVLANMIRATIDQGLAVISNDDHFREKWLKEDAAGKDRLELYARRAYRFGLVAAEAMIEAFARVSLVVVDRGGIFSSLMAADTFARQLQLVLKVGSDAGSDWRSVALELKFLCDTNVPSMEDHLRQLRQVIVDRGPSFPSDVAPP